MTAPLARLIEALADRYRIAPEPRAGRPRPAATVGFGPTQRLRGVAPPSACLLTHQARETLGELK